MTTLAVINQLVTKHLSTD